MIREEQYFAFLDRLRTSGCNIAQAKGRLEQAFPNLKHGAASGDALISTWQAKRRSAQKSPC